MKLEVYTPKSEILLNIIECFYTLQRDEHDKPITYYGFPSNNVFITFCENAEVTIKKETLIIKNKQDNNLKTLLIIDNKKPGATTYIGKTNEITIYFKPLGINGFLNKPLSQYHVNGVLEFDFFNAHSGELLSILKTGNQLQKMQLLEMFLISKLKKFEHAFLHHALSTIKNGLGLKLSINTMAKNNKVSRTTFNKQFLLHIGTTPVQFIKIERFRSAIKTFTGNSTTEQLIDVAYLVNYFDQSHMAKDFIALTGFSPKIFFAKISKEQGKTINWIFL